MQNLFQRCFLSILVALGIVGSAGATDFYGEAWERIKNGALLIDVRTPAEYAEGHLAGAINIPYQNIVNGLAQKNITLDADIVLYCRSGNRSGKAHKALVAQGYKNTLNAGGYRQLQDRSLK
ncbi:rhodanese-like domain-containing protein [Endozoicomonas elysicola]|uniref:Sulfurtransferase n=1 Tax=Endozoicomonas elysicola TaxID=305900 RepID=A0A081KF81_9GAMM|nr:rhodanese-like domain-containing protein [Endozoicomonas elysicola]KEI72807.1 sulfurtransferase [Endozoicomonas elysicola]